MNVAIAVDHGGFPLKGRLAQVLQEIAEIEKEGR